MKTHAKELSRGYSRIRFISNTKFLFYSRKSRNHRDEIDFASRSYYFGQANVRDARRERETEGAYSFGKFRSLGSIFPPDHVFLTLGSFSARPGVNKIVKSRRIELFSILQGSRARASFLFLTSPPLSLSLSMLDLARSSDFRYPPRVRGTSSFKMASG